MKKLFALFIIASTCAVAQQAVDADFILRKTSPQSYTSFAKISGRAYTTSTIDTSIAYPCKDWKSFYVTVQSKDSASCIIKYQISIDSGGATAPTWSAIATKDTLTTVEDGGSVKPVDLTDQVLGATWVRVILDFTSGDQGVTSATYSATIKRYPY